MDGKQKYWLTDPDTGRRFNASEMMDEDEAKRRNGFLERQLSRWKWMLADA